MSVRWRLLRQERPASGATNMATDAVLLRAQEWHPLPTLRLYRWREPAISLGYAQEPTGQLRLEACRAAGVELVRRPTGGGVVFHDRSMTFSWIAPVGVAGLPTENEELSGWIGGIVVDALSSLGVPAEVAGECRCPPPVLPDWCLFRPVRFDVIHQGRKIAGLAQRRLRFGILAQVYLLLRLPRPEVLLAAGGVQAAVAAASWSVGAAELSPRPLSVEAVEEALIDAFGKAIGSSPEGGPPRCRGDRADWPRSR
ncbi:MAG: hypothetical protein KatS3mg115_2014 [Candidatus Poribacteria bacterium]|nr:MAG: hypothetical protein KatS3mg115_2014 [Candidatus Poribacteria bacterium]